MEEAKITFYNVEKCGLYEYGADDRKLGDLPSFLKQLKFWVTKNNKPLQETCTYSIEESEDIDRTFCYDIRENSKTGDFLLTTWNETPSYQGKVAAVKGASIVGNAQVEFTELPKDSIPGYATYFWFIPDKNVFATIRFQHKLNGKKNLDKYLREFISKFSDYVVLGEEETVDFQIIGYAKNKNESPLNLHPYLTTSIVRKPGQIKYILEQSNKITKITRHNKLIPNLEDSQELWQKALYSLGLKNKRELKTEVKFSYEFSFSPTKDELNEIIIEWENNHDLKWDDIGFTLKGDPVPKWLSNSLARDHFELSVKRINDEIIDAESLLEKITEKRDLILALLG